MIFRRHLRRFQPACRLKRRTDAAEADSFTATAKAIYI